MRGFRIVTIVAMLSGEQVQVGMGRSKGAGGGHGGVHVFTARHRLRIIDACPYTVRQIKLLDLPTSAPSAAHRCSCWSSHRAPHLRASELRHPSIPAVLDVQPAAKLTEAVRAGGVDCASAIAAWLHVADPVVGNSKRKSMRRGSFGTRSRLMQSELISSL